MADSSDLKECPNDIDIWRVDLADGAIDNSIEILSTDERQRADKFVFPKDRNSFSRSRCALRFVLANYLNCRADGIQFHYAEHGKPELSEPAPDQLSFNLSHDGDIALIAIAHARRVGVDVNRLGRMEGTTAWVPIAKRSLSLKEQKLLFALPQLEQEEAFFRIWTQKEAYTKARGDGFTYGFQNFTVQVNEGAGLVEDDKHPEAIGQWHIASIGPYENKGHRYVASLSYEGARSSIRQREFVLADS